LALEIKPEELGDGQPWIPILECLLENGAAKVGILLHWYSGRVVSERFEITRREFDACELCAALLLELPEDTLYLFS